MRRALLVGLATAIASVFGVTAPGVPVEHVRAACPEPFELDARMGDLLLAIKPKMPLAEVVALIGPPTRDRFYPKEDGTREAMFEPRVQGGSREIGAGLQCSFDSGDSLTQCQVDFGPFHTQYVERDQVSRLRHGDGFVQVVGELCLPGRIALLESGGLQASYFYRAGGQYGSQSVTLDFDPAGRLAKIETGH